MAVAQSSASAIHDTTLNFGAYTHKAGREANEDSCTLEALQRKESPQLGALVAVADGMGGGEAGKTASTIAIGSLGERYFESGSTASLNSLRQAVNDANSAVYAFAVTARRSKPIGTTMVAAAVVGARATIVNVGDSRAYLIRNGQATQITRDHNWANQQIKQGLLSSEQAMAHENAPKLTQVLGQAPNIQMPMNGQADDDFSFERNLQPGDALLLCSDGVTGVVPPHELASIVLGAPASQAAQQIVERAIALKTTDNATAVVVHYGVNPRRPCPPLWMFGAGGAAVLVLLALVAVFAMPSGNPDNPKQPKAPNPTNGAATISGPPTAIPEQTTGGTTPGRATSTMLPASPTPEPSNTPVPPPTRKPVTARPTLPGQPSSRPTSPPPQVPSAPTAVFIEPPVPTVVPTTVPPSPTAVPTEPPPPPTNTPQPEEPVRPSPNPPKPINPPKP